MDVTINRYNAQSERQFVISVFRKPTTTDCIFPYDSCHTVNHRLASIRLISTRLYTYALLSQDKETETQILSNIICNNHFNLNILDQVNYKNNKRSKKTRNSMNKKEKNNNKKDIFHLRGTKFTKKKMFRNTKIDIPLKAKNIIEKLLAYKQ